MTVTYDFSSPFMSAAIFTTDGTRIALASNNSGGPNFALASKTNDALASFPYVSEISVELNLSYMAKIRVVLSPPYSDAIAFLDSPLIEWGSSIIEVQFGYTGGASPQGVLTPIFSGVMLKPDIVLGAESTIILNAQGIGAFSAVRQEGQRQFNKASRFNIIKGLLAGPDPAHPRRIEFSEKTVFLDETKDVEEINRMFKDTVDFSQAGKTDWQCVYELVNECRCFMTLIGDTLRVFSKRSSWMGAVTKVFALFPGNRLGPDIGGGVWPILNVDSPTSAVYLPGAARGLVVSGINSTDRKVTRQVVGDEQAQVARTNKGASAPGASEIFPDAPAASDSTQGSAADANGNTMHPGSPDDPVSIQQAKAEFENLTNIGVTLNVETIGVPDLVPGDLVIVHGCGARISGERNGRYNIHHITHTHNNSGWTTKWTGIANAAVLNDGVPAKGPQNNAEAPSTSLSGRVPLGPSTVVDLGPGPLR